jgi:undecaprenyl-diphosphatase
MSSHLNFAEAGIVGLLQGVTELFPVSSLGHAVLIPAIAPGRGPRTLNVSNQNNDQTRLMRNHGVC